MSSGDPRETILRALARQLPGGPLRRRRVLTELADHIDDAVDDLCGSGLPREEAIEVAVRRLGDAETIAHTFDLTRARTARRPRLRVRHSLAWMMVAAMSLVTAVAAELPQASGAKPSTKVVAAASSRPAPTDRAAARHPVTGTSALAAPRHRRPAERR